jgi:hypothetical protein
MKNALAPLLSKILWWLDHHFGGAGIQYHLNCMMEGEAR